MKKIKQKLYLLTLLKANDCEEKLRNFSWTLQQFLYKVGSEENRLEESRFCNYNVRFLNYATALELLIPYNISKYIFLDEMENEGTLLTSFLLIFPSSRHTRNSIGVLVGAFLVSEDEATFIRNNIFRESKGKMKLSYTPYCIDIPYC